VLDYGCGEALYADRVAAAATRLLLCEEAPRVRTALKSRFGGEPKIEVVAQQDLAEVPDRTLDLIVLHSVVQYLTAAEAGAVFALFRRLLKAGGLLVVGDVIPPNTNAATDAWALLRFGAAKGFFTAALQGMLRALLSDYWRLRARLGLTRYSETAMIEKLGAAGFAAQRAPMNFGHNQARMAFFARPR
jgi:SAM-dependent methyltransferase